MIAKQLLAEEEEIVFKDEKAENQPPASASAPVAKIVYNKEKPVIVEEKVNTDL